MKFNPALKLHCGEHPVFRPTAVVRTMVTLTPTSDGMVRCTARAQLADKRIVEVSREHANALGAWVAVYELDDQIKRLA